MMNVQFEGARPIGKPSDMTDEGCSSAWAYPYLQEVDVADEQGNPTGKKMMVQCFLMCYQPSKEDMEAIAAGGQVWLKFIAPGLVPHALWTHNPITGEPNF